MVRVIKKDDSPTIIIEIEWSKTNAIIPIDQVYDSEYFHMFGFLLNAPKKEEETLSKKEETLSKSDDIISFDKYGNLNKQYKQEGGDKISGPYSLLHSVFNSVETAISSDKSKSQSPETTSEIDEGQLQSILVPSLPIQTTDSSVLTIISDSSIKLELTLEEDGDHDRAHITSPLTEYIKQMKAENAKNIQCFPESGLDYHTIESIVIDIYKQVTYLGTKNIEFTNLSLSDIYYICGNYVIIKSGEEIVEKDESSKQAQEIEEIITKISETGAALEESNLSEMKESLKQKRIWWV